MSNSKPVLVAGGAGYIGSHTVKALAQAGFTPVVLDDLSTGHFKSVVNYGEFYHGSITDTSVLNRIFKSYTPVGTLIFAGSISVGESTLNPRKYYENNVMKCLNFIHYLMDQDCAGNIVFSSSASVYGNHGMEPITESDTKDPLSPYAESKMLIEQVLKWYDSAYNVRSACLRYFNAAGADAEGEMGESHQPETHLIPLALEALTSGKALKIFGDDYPTPDGTAIRDYIHVTDLANAHVLALQNLLDKSKSFAANLGTGQGSSVLDLINAIEQVTGQSLPVEFFPRRSGDAPMLVADITLAKNLLNWEPQHSSLENIVKTAWQWHLNKTY